MKNENENTEMMKESLQTENEKTASLDEEDRVITVRTEEDVKPTREEMSLPLPGEEAETIDGERLMRMASNPMFVHFARGRKDGIDRICRDFEAMLAAGGRPLHGVSATDMAKMTPSVGLASPDLALSERQREIARAAGMTYREYYESISALPDKMPRSQ